MCLLEKKKSLSSDRKVTVVLEKQGTALTLVTPKERPWWQESKSLTQQQRNH